MFKSDQVLMEKWAPVLDHESAPIIESHEKRAVTARLLENTEEALISESQQGTYSISEAVAGTTTASAENPDPVLISLVRRAMPNLIAYDVCGVQPMSGPTGLIFAMKSRFDDQSGGVTSADTEALFNEADTDFSGEGGTAHIGETGIVLASTLSADDIAQIITVGDTNYNATNVGGGAGFAVGTIFTRGSAAPTGNGTVVVLGHAGVAMSTAAGEEKDPARMGFTVEKVSVTAKTRVLQAEYSMELAQDLKAVHGLDAEAELSNILSAEILGEINREVIKTINDQAKLSTSGSDTGVIDVNDDTDVGKARWQAEKFQALGFRLEQEANIIAKETRRGKGNYIICSSTVAAALSAAGSLAYGSAITAGDLTVDNAGNTFAGTLKNGMKVYVDPYAGHNFATVGFKGSNSYDAGIYYCPYVPLTQLKAVDATTFQPKIGFKTRYGMVANPFADESGAIGDSNNVLTVAQAANPYFRRAIVTNI